MVTRFSKDVAWLEPFYEAAKDLIPARRLKEVKGYQVPISRWICNEAICYQSKDNSCVIVLRIKNHKGRKGRVIRQQPMTVETLLMNFAHELAHVSQPFGQPLKRWHEIAHWELSLKINRRFLKVLRKYDVKNLSAKRCKKLGKKE